MKHRPTWLALGLLTALVQTSSAAWVQSDYLFDPGQGWRVSLSVGNDGSPAGALTGFTVFFDEALFSQLTLIDAPVAWDSLVIAPDLNLSADGYLDAFAQDAAHALNLGDSVGTFVLGFNYLGAGQPGALPYDIVDAQYQVLASGLSQVQVSVVPEPSAALLCCLGLAWLSACVRRGGQLTRHTEGAQA